MTQSQNYEILSDNYDIKKGISEKVKINILNHN